MEINKLSIQQLISWSNSERFSKLCQNAERGDDRCDIFVDRFLRSLSSLMFHLNNGSHDKRIELEIRELNKLVFYSRNLC
ncbi:MAG TPA: hypothetical protein DHU78_08615 [Opitutae bacterium]|nr:hypothetical protein [Puniceicoccaceae bacterium]HAU59386.1 hypothetical protein [Opitutae bacterium]HCY58899.1 hypothetical protein [Opitutae bacterium]